MDKVCIVEGIMGSGKSSAIINQILDNPKEKLILIVNYIKETERYRKKLKFKNFKLMGENIKSKSVDLERSLKNQDNIICTKKLFEMNRKLIEKYATEYILIVDEAMNDIIELYEFPSVVKFKKEEIEPNQYSNQKIKSYQDFSFTSKDIEIMLNQGILTKDPENDKLSWNNELSEATIYDILKDDFETYDIYKFQDSYYKVLPIEIFNVFKRVYILTYMWNTQVMKYYFQMHNINDFHIEYPLLVNKKFILTQLEWKYLEYANKIKKEAKKHIYLQTEGNKWTYKNAKGKEINLSYNFYANEAKKPENQLVIDKLRANINSLIQHNPIFKTKTTRKEMWTVYINAIDIIISRKYGKPIRGLNKDNFVEYNKIATNELSDRNTLFYLIDRYKNPLIKRFSELIQWIWRSAIRNNNDIFLYIASDRMNKLFYNWLESEETTSSGFSEMLIEACTNLKENLE